MALILRRGVGDLSVRVRNSMPYRADKPTGRLIPRRLSFPLVYNDLRCMGLLVGLILGRHDMALGPQLPYRAVQFRTADDRSE